MDDRSLLVEWVEAFAPEAVPDSPATASSMVDARLKEGTGGFLYTDLDNPTSNKIYTEIGYEPVCDSVDYAFEPA